MVKSSLNMELRHEYWINMIVTKWCISDEYAVDGISIASNIIISGSESANAYKLYQNEPNPFNGTTTVKFYVPENSEVMMEYTIC